MTCLWSDGGGGVADPSILFPYLCLISNTAQDPPTPLGMLGFSWIPTHHRASPIFVPSLIRHPDSNIVFLLWQVCYATKSLFSKGFPSLCTQQLRPHFFKINSLLCSSLWTGENCLTQALFIGSEKEENHAILCSKPGFQIQLYCLKEGFCSTYTPENLAECSAQSRLSQGWLSFQLFQSKSTPSWKPTSMQMCII